MNIRRFVVLETSKEDERYGTYPCFEMVESPEGEWVSWKDVQSLVEDSENVAVAYLEHKGWHDKTKCQHGVNCNIDVENAVKFGSETIAKTIMFLKIAGWKSPQEISQLLKDIEDRINLCLKETKGEHAELGLTSLPQAERLGYKTSLECVKRTREKFKIEEFEKASSIAKESVEKDKSL